MSYIDREALFRSSPPIRMIRNLRNSAAPYPPGVWSSVSEPNCEAQSSQLNLNLNLNLTTSGLIKFHHFRILAYDAVRIRTPTSESSNTYTTSGTARQFLTGLPYLFQHMSITWTRKLSQPKILSKSCSVLRRYTGKSAILESLKSDAGNPGPTAAGVRAVHAVALHKAHTTL